MYEKLMLERLGCPDAVKAYWNAVAPHLQAFFCHSSLGTKIKIRKVGDLVYLDEKITYGTSAWLNHVNVRKKAAEVLGKADLVAIMAGHSSGGGIAHVGTVCSGSGSIRSITGWYADPARFAVVSSLKTDVIMY